MGSYTHSPISPMPLISRTLSKVYREGGEVTFVTGQDDSGRQNWSQLQTSLDHPPAQDFSLLHPDPA